MWSLRVARSLLQPFSHHTLGAQGSLQRKTINCRWKPRTDEIMLMYFKAFKNTDMNRG